MEKESLQELERAIETRNYAAAVRIAESFGRRPDEIRDLQRKAVKQLILEDRNAQGAIGLSKEYRFAKEEMAELLQEILREAEEKKILEKRQFDIQTMRYLTLKEWIDQYFRR